MANLKDLIVNGSARIIGNLYATLKGNADTATKLETSRTIRTNLSSTNAVGFDGSANITPGIQGTLGVANGGTGQTSVANIQAGKDGNGNTISSTYLKQADQGNILPNFDAMTVLQTIEFDTSDSNWHTICTRNNTETNPKDVVDCVYFRITVTGTNINQVADCAWIMKGQANSNPMLLINYMPGTSDGAYSGFRYIREIYPKALNNGYKWALEVLQNRNNNARHYKIQVFKTNSNYTWTQGTASTFNSTYHNAAQYGAETTSGYFISYLNGTVGQASNAGGLNDRLNKVFNTNFPAGAAILVNQFIYMNNNKHYPATDKTKAIEPGYGIQFTNTAYNANNDVGWDRIRQKQRITDLTNIPHATLARGNPCYFRCTMDSNGNILSDNYVATSMANGYTWYYVGVAESVTAITLDTTQSFFITLDSDGKLTHVNGKEVGSSGGSSRNIGERVESKLPLTDSGLHLLDGGVIQRGSYTAFVDYIAGLYNTNPNADYFCQRKEKPWVQPIATASTTAITGGDMVITTSSEYSTYNAWKAMDGIKSGTVATTGWGTNNTSATQWWQLKLPYQIRITGIKVYHRYDGTASNANTIGRFYTSSAMTTPIGNELNDMSAVNWSETIITGIPSSGIATNTLYFQKTGGGNYGGLGEVEITATVVNDYMTPEEVWQYSVDTYGSCDKFVYDSTAKTVRLPKRTTEHGELLKSYKNGTDWYRIYEDGWCEQGSYKPTSGSELTTVDLLKSYIDSNYDIYFGEARTLANSHSGSDNSQIKLGLITTSNFGMYINTTSGNGVFWQACGYVDISDYQYNPIYEYLVLATTAKTNIQVDIDEVMTDLNAKVDKSDLSEVHCVVETYQNGGDWYRLYDDGWVEQGGSFGTAYASYTQKTFSFLKPFMTTNYFVTCHSASTGDLYFPSIVSKSLMDVTFYGTYNLNGYGNWYACGYGE